jgi:hypothetical protein
MARHIARPRPGLRKMAPWASSCTKMNRRTCSNATTTAAASRTGHQGANAAMATVAPHAAMVNASRR